MPDQQRGEDGHLIPEIQGIVSGQIQPMQANEMKLGNIGKALGQAVGVAIFLPQFAVPPKLVPNTEAVREDGTKIENTGSPYPPSIVASEATLDQATAAADRVLAMLDKLPITNASVDVMNMAVAIRHYVNKGSK